MKKITILLMILGLVFGSAVIGFAAGGQESEEEGGYTLGIAMSTLANPYFLLQAETGEKKALELGIDKESLFVLDAQDDVTKQVHQVEDLINRGVDAIILNPVDSDAVGSVVMDANRAKIPVVTLTRPSHGGDVLQHVDTDNMSGARMAGEMVAKAMNYKGQVIELTGIPGAPSTRDRAGGFEEIIANYPDIKIVAKQTANYNRQQGLEVTENLLEGYPDVDAIFAHNDEMALGVLAALKAANRTDIMIFGFDGASEVIEAIDRGEIDGTIVQQPTVQVETAVETAIKYITEGVEPEKEIILCPCVPYPED